MRSDGGGAAPENSLGLAPGLHYSMKDVARGRLAPRRDFFGLSEGGQGREETAAVRVAKRAKISSNFG